MKKLRPGLTYANIVSTLALCIAVGGASAFAATQLAKNSVGPKQLKRNAVTSPKIKQGAVTGAKIRDGAVTGAKVDAGTLGTVPSAQTAQTAKGLAAPEAWHLVGQPGEPGFLNGWSDNELGSPPIGFYRDATGIVRLRGELSGPDAAQAAFVLPPGFRPSAFLAFPSYGGPEASVGVNASGSVTPYCDGAGGCQIGLDGASFRAES